MLMDKGNDFVIMGEGEAEVSLKITLSDLFKLINHDFQTFRFAVYEETIFLRVFDTQAEGFEYDEEMESKKKDKEA